MNLPQTLADYSKLDVALAELLEAGKEREYAHVLRVLCKRDLYALIRYVLTPRVWKNRETGEPFWDNQWLFDRCRDAQFRSANVLDIWARYHCKSTIKTFALTIFQMINDPNETIGIFSITKTNAEAFLRQIKTELEQNELLKTLYPDVFFWDPAKESAHWTVNNGFNIKRTINSNTSSLEALGLVDSNYAGKRFSRQKYDDVVTEASITSPDMIEKTTRGWELSMATGMPGTIREYTGTFYAYGDTYHVIVKRGITLRLYPCYEMVKDKCSFHEDTGLPKSLEFDRDKPTLFSAEHLKQREMEMGPSTFGTQMLCDPNAGLAQGLKEKWLNFYESEPHKVAKNKPRVFVVDSANSKKQNSDYTVIWAFALGEDGNAYLVDGVRDRMNPNERANALFSMHQRWKPLEVRYERYGMMIDIEFMQKVMESRHYHFPITEVKGNTRKDDRISRLIPWFATGRIYLPKTLPYVTVAGEEVDLVKQFIEDEYLSWPTSVFKDMLDAMSRLAEPELPLPWPMAEDFYERADTRVWQRRIKGARRRANSPTGSDWQAA